MSAENAILERCAALGWRVVVIPIARRSDAIAAIEKRHANGELDEAFYQEYLAPLLAEALPEAPSARSIILVATPSHPIRMHFTLDGVAFPVLTAPGYLRGASPKPLDVLNEVLAPFGHSAAAAYAPQKTLATISGFARYGRNNITYVEGLGSFLALGSPISDLPCAESPAGEQRALPRCSACRACAEACPTGAIGDDRFLIHAERCITFWNEKSPDVAFPDWIEPEWHNALFGCLHCQRVCPENQPYASQVLEGPTFDEATTRRLLAGSKPDDFADDVREALAAWRLTDLLDYLPRNLGALARKEELRRAGKLGSA